MCFKITCDIWNCLLWWYSSKTKNNLCRLRILFTTMQLWHSVYCKSLMLRPKSLIFGSRCCNKLRRVVYALILKGEMAVLFCKITVPQAPPGGREKPFSFQNNLQVCLNLIPAHLPFGTICLFHVNDFNVTGNMIRRFAAWDWHHSWHFRLINCLGKLWGVFSRQPLIS